MSKEYIRIKGVRQNNLKGLDLELPLGELIVVTGVSGSGKSSLAFDTVYARGVPTNLPWGELAAEHQDWVLEGDGDWTDGVWYGVRRFFGWPETKYRAYNPCPDCGGARLKDEALLWRVGTRAQADAVLAPSARFRPAAIDMPGARWRALPDLGVHDVLLLPIARCRALQIWTD